MRYNSTRTELVARTHVHFNLPVTSMIESCCMLGSIGRNIHENLQNCNDVGHVCLAETAVGLKQKIHEASQLGFTRTDAERNC